MNPALPTQTASSRRAFLGASAALAAGLSTGSVAGAEPNTTTALAAPNLAADTMPSFRYCLNTSSINGSKVPILEQIKIASSAGYDSIEIWLRDVQRHLDAGGTLEELAKVLEESNLGVDSAIAFGNWIVDDEQNRQAGLEQCRKDMEVVRALGGSRIAAPPAGATRESGLDLSAAGERYHALLEVGKDVGVLPQVELWGFSANLSKLEEVLYVAAAAKHPDACILLDVYHLYKGGSDFENLGLVPGHKMHCLHMNDYPAEPPRNEIGDKDRVYPGDGVAPMTSILQTLAKGGFAGTLSLELFNRQYWKLPAAEVAKTGLEKMKACVNAAFTG